jgi:hypothetical protein
MHIINRKIVTKSLEQLSDYPNRINEIMSNYKLGLLTTHEFMCLISEFTKLAQMRLQDKIDESSLDNREFTLCMNMLETIND